MLQAGVLGVPFQKGPEHSLSPVEQPLSKINLPQGGGDQRGVQFLDARDGFSVLHHGYRWDDLWDDLRRPAGSAIPGRVRLKDRDLPIQLFRNGIGVIPNHPFRFDFRVRDIRRPGVGLRPEGEDAIGEIQVDGVLHQESFQKAQGGNHLTPVQEYLRQSPKCRDVVGIEFESGAEP